MNNKLQQLLTLVVIGICFSSCKQTVQTSNSPVISGKIFNLDHTKTCVNQFITDADSNLNFRSVYQVDFYDSLKHFVKTGYVMLSVFNNRCAFDTSQYYIEWRTVKKENNEFVEFPRYQSASTGVLSSRAEVFLHPIRQREYKKLELAPFPYIVFDTVQWEFNFNIGEHYCTAGIYWTENLYFRTSYHLLGEKKFIINQQLIPCQEVLATSESALSHSELHFFYNNHFGFVMLHYYNVDKTEMVFTLIE
jgi:hypothetical protein